MLIRVLLVGEDDASRSRLESLLAMEDVALTALAAEIFWSEPRREPFDLAIVGRDDLPAEAGRAVERLRRLPGKPEVAVHYPEAEPRDALELQAAGVFAVLRGALADPQFARALAKLIARLREILKVRLRAADVTQAPLSADEFVAESPAIRQVLKMARRVAASDTTVLLLGETGTGKDWLARVIHGESPRASSPFIAVNCGAVPENLLESELFGHVKGAFTGAVKDRRGYFELAHRGTLFLDEVAEMPPHLQVKLLRVLQDQAIQRLGSEEAVAIDVRIIAATNRDLREALRAEKFRQDLYYRLAVVSLTLPALAERREDIPELVEIYWKKYARKLARSEVTGVTPRAMAALTAYDWPGNVRELINVVERAVLLCEATEIDLADLPLEMAAARDARLIGTGQAPLTDIGPWLDQPLDAGRLAVVADFERRYLIHQLEHFHGNVGKTARQAGVDPRTVHTKMKQLGLRKEDFKRG